MSDTSSDTSSDSIDNYLYFRNGKISLLDGNFTPKSDDDENLYPEIGYSFTQEWINNKAIFDNIYWNILPPIFFEKLPTELIIIILSFVYNKSNISKFIDYLVLFYNNLEIISNDKYYNQESYTIIVDDNHSQDLLIQILNKLCKDHSTILDIGRNPNNSPILHRYIHKLNQYNRPFILYNINYQGYLNEFITDTIITYRPHHYSFSDQITVNKSSNKFITIFTKDNYQKLGVGTHQRVSKNIIHLTFGDLIILDKLGFKTIFPIVISKILENNKKNL